MISSNLIPLSSLESGDMCKILHIIKSDMTTSRRLSAMGFIKDAIVKVRKVASLGMVLVVKDQNFALPIKDCKNILVEMVYLEEN